MGKRKHLCWPATAIVIHHFSRLRFSLCSRVGFPPVESEELPEGLGEGAMRCPQRGRGVLGGLFVRISSDCVLHEKGQEEGGSAGTCGKRRGRRSPTQSRKRRIPLHAIWRLGPRLGGGLRDISLGRNRRRVGTGRRQGRGPSEVQGFRCQVPTLGKVPMSLAARAGCQTTTAG